ncbi:cupin domain-containing protein [Streptomyces ipomoeae]|jgi:quercetin dioxygenase-like cupin family protein|uniref:Cupin domain protein n=5 Tax=Streptomyces ipomoeae TaxID=103232 RepID=L1L8X5_9ACTN|nr:cupin domain-containing protein [Streptomyces ipomoeae]EKX69155.1 cupin domain protein [Streptomyces ipomoeae 91-03]MDX2697349.1 cupin domain-containing protein [Streptomyces ipomoeae]TQE33321.1 cupin domain-containing protein [Streptomyces ipomoeae]TQE39551.1 cupin domain-containing protein [Streptomyces ipomoeae]
MAKNAHVRHSGDGKAFWMLNSLYEVKASSDETNGAMTVMEMTIPEGMGPPPHTHPGTESVYVIEGTLRYHIADETVEAGPGSFIHIPEGTLERFEPTSTVRLLITYTPGGIEGFFAEAGEPAERRELPPQSDVPPDVDRLIEIAKRHGVQMQPMPGA